MTKSRSVVISRIPAKAGIRIKNDGIRMMTSRIPAKAGIRIKNDGIRMMTSRIPAKAGIQIKNVRRSADRSALL